MSHFEKEVYTCLHCMLNRLRFNNSGMVSTPISDFALIRGLSFYPADQALDAFFLPPPPPLIIMLANASSMSSRVFFSWWRAMFALRTLLTFTLGTASPLSSLSYHGLSPCWCDVSCSYARAETE